MAKKSEQPLRWNLKKELRALKSWLADRDDERTRARLSSAIGDPAKHTRVVSGWLSDLALAEATRGAISVGERDPLGWINVHTAWRYEAYDHFVHAVSVDQDIKAGKPPLKQKSVTDMRIWGQAAMNIILLGLATGVALGEDKYVDWLADRLLRSLREHDPLINHDGAWDMPFNAFMIQLYARWRGEALELSCREVRHWGPYPAVFEAWNDDTAFAAAVGAICDYHCAHVRSDYDDFSWPPYSVFPGEILALLRIRREMGLSVPKIEHPLLDTPLAQVPNPLPKREQDETLESVVRRCMEVSPEFAPPW